MLPLGFNVAYRTAHQRPHRPVVRCEVWQEDIYLGEVKPIAGSVKCTLGSQVTRTGSITLDPSLTPRRPGDMLAPYGNRLRIYRGIAYGEREFMFPVFNGLITKAERRPRQPLTVSFADRAAEVDENDFEAPAETKRNRTLVDEIIRFISDGVPDARFAEVDQVGAAAPAQVFDESRSRACDQLAEAAGMFWYALADGRFTIRRVPWAWHPDPDNVTTVRTYTEDPAFFGRQQAKLGTISDYGVLMSRENVYNAIVGLSDQPDGAEPRRAVAIDTSLDSPTYVGGKFGRRVLRADVPSAATAGVVHTAVESLLRRSRASADVTPWTMVPDPSLELGDAVRLDIDDRHLLRVVSAFDMPLTEDGEMTCEGRPLVLPGGRVIDELTGVYDESGSTP